jgi:hypothetical protein
MVDRLSVLPKIRSISPARDGDFADDTDGTVVVSNDGTAWRRVPAPEQRDGIQGGRSVGPDRG